MGRDDSGASTTHAHVSSLPGAPSHTSEVWMPRAPAYARLIRSLHLSIRDSSVVDKADCSEFEGAGIEPRWRPILHQSISLYIIEESHGRRKNG